MATRSPASDGGLREALLAAAELELAERGVAAVSVRAVARRAGVSHQAPAHHFGNRRGLLTALAVRGLERLVAAMRDALDDAGERSARERLSALGVAYIRFAVAHREPFRLASHPDLVDLGSPEITRLRESSWGMLTAAVVDAQRDGWRSDQPVADVVLLSWVTVHGAASVWADGLAAAQLPASELASMIRTVTDGL